MAAGTSDDPWVLKTPPGSSEYTMHMDGDQLVCQVGSTRLTYRARVIDDLQTWLRAEGGWVALGAADEQKPAPEGGVGKIGVECRRRVVRHTKGVSRPTGHVRAPVAGGTRACRADPQRARQPHASDLSADRTART